MGLFFSFEGPDGSGKSTQAHRIATWLRLHSYTVSETREPGGTPLGDRLRELILDPASPSATPLAMALLLSASRAQLLSEVIRPALAAGDLVLVDRYADSTVAYQSYGLGLHLETVKALATIATGGLRPDVIIYLDIEPEVGLARMRARGAPNRLDAQTLGFHHRVRAGYRQMMAEEPGRWIAIDGAGDPERVQQAIIEAIKPRLDGMAGVK